MGSVIKGAGILFIYTKENSILLLRRSQLSSDAGLWDLPGGHLNEDENASTGAYREVIEELGTAPNGKAIDMIKSSGQGWEYTIFVVDLSVDQKDNWIIKLNNEHDKYKWFQTSFLPKNLHSTIKDLF